jgi:quercetin dioxygenase-like cupin family protein
MPFHRFETYADQMLTVHLSSAKGPIIEGESIYFCLVTKEPGTGSEIHYHPNEQFQIPLSGKLNALVGTDRRIMRPGTMSHPSLRPTTRSRPRRTARPPISTSRA